MNNMEVVLLMQCVYICLYFGCCTGSVHLHAVVWLEEQHLSLTVGWIVYLKAPLRNNVAGTKSKKGHLRAKSRSWDKDECKPPCKMFGFSFHLVEWWQHTLMLQEGVGALGNSEKCPAHRIIQFKLLYVLIISSIEEQNRGISASLTLS